MIALDSGWSSDRVRRSDFSSMPWIAELGALAECCNEPDSSIGREEGCPIAG